MVNQGIFPNQTLQLVCRGISLTSLTYSILPASLLSLSHLRTKKSLHLASNSCLAVLIDCAVLRVTFGDLRGPNPIGDNAHNQGGDRTLCFDGLSMNGNTSMC